MKKLTSYLIILTLLLISLTTIYMRSKSDLDFELAAFMIFLGQVPVYGLYRNSGTKDNAQTLRLRQMGPLACIGLPLLIVFALELLTFGTGPFLSIFGIKSGSSGMNIISELFPSMGITLIFFAINTATIFGLNVMYRAEHLLPELTDRN